MAWTTPRDWTGISNDIVTAAMLNVDVRDNLLVLSTHAHSGAAGMGASSMSGLSLAALATLTFADQSANPDAAGELQRNGNDILWYGSSVVNLTAADASAGTASLRSIGTTAVKAAAGNHTHTMSQQAEDLSEGGSATVDGNETDVVTKTYSCADTANVVVFSVVARFQSSLSYTHTGKLYFDGSVLETRAGIGGVANADVLYIFQALVSPASTSGKVYKFTSQLSNATPDVTVWADLGITEVTM